MCLWKHEGNRLFTNPFKRPTISRRSQIYARVTPRSDPRTLHEYAPSEANTPYRVSDSDLYICLKKLKAGDEDESDKEMKNQEELNESIYTSDVDTLFENGQTKETLIINRNNKRYKVNNYENRDPDFVEENSPLYLKRPIVKHPRDRVSSRRNSIAADQAIVRDIELST